MSSKNKRCNIVKERRKTLDDIHAMKGVEVSELEFKLFRIDFDESMENTRSILRMLQLEGMDVKDVSFKGSYMIVDSC